MSSVDFSIGSFATDKNSPNKSNNGRAPDSDSNDSSIIQSSPAKRNHEQENSIVVGTTDEELKYRRTLFPFEDFSSIKKKGLECSTCGCKILIQAGEEICSHIYLQVALCKKCKKFYGKGDFSVDEDGTDKFCRWCGNGGDLFCCSSCTCVFCRKCVKRNLGRNAVKKIEDEDSWDCFICDIKPLWELRGLCWGGQKYIDTLHRTKKKKVNETLLELSEKKRRPPDRRQPVRRKNASSTDSEDEVAKSNSDSTDGSNKPRNKSRHTIRKLFTQEDGFPLLISSDSERNERRKTRKLPSTSTQANGFEPVSSDLDSETEKNKPTDKHKKASNPVPKKSELPDDSDSDLEQPKDKVKGKKPAFFESQAKEFNTGKQKKKKADVSSDSDSSNEEKEVDRLITSKSTDSRPASSVGAAMISDSDDDETHKARKKTQNNVSKKSDSSDDTVLESQSYNKGRSKKKPASLESQDKKISKGERNKNKKDESSTEDSDGGEKEVGKSVIPKSRAKGRTSHVGEEAKPSDSGSSDELEQPKNKGKAKKKTAFHESQAKEYNTGKRRRNKKDDTASSDEEDAQKEMDSFLTSKSTASRVTSPVSDAVTDSDSDDDRGTASKKSTKRLQKKGDLLDEFDRLKSQKGNGNTRMKPTKVEKRKKRVASSNSIVGDSRPISRVSPILENNLDSDDASVSSKITPRRNSSETLRNSGLASLSQNRTDVEMSESIGSALRKGRRSSCVVPYSDSKKTVKKRSASAGDSFEVDRVQTDLTEKDVVKYDDSTSGSEDSNSSEDMPLKIDKATSEKMLTYMQEQCSVTHALGEALCRVSEIIDSKMKASTDFTDTRNIKDMYKRMKSMSKGMKRNVNALELAFVSKYKSWKKGTRPVSGNSCASTSKDSQPAMPVKRIRTKVAVWEEMFQHWAGKDSTPKAIKKKKALQDDLPGSSTEDESAPVSKKVAKGSSKDLKYSDSVDKEDKRFSPSNVGTQEVEVNESASLNSNQTQLYDYEKQFNDLTNTVVDKEASNDDNLAASDDMFSDTEPQEPLGEQTPHTGKEKSKIKKKNGSKLSAEFVDHSSNESAGDENPADNERAQSTDTEDFPLATQLTKASRENTASPTADIANKKISESEEGIAKTSKAGVRNKSRKSTACPKSKKKKSISAESKAEDRHDSSADMPPKEATSDEEPAVEGKPESKTRLSLKKSNKDQRKSKNFENDMSPSKAKALLLASSSDDEPLDASDSDTTKSGKKSSRKSKEKKSSSKKKDKRSTTNSRSKRSSVSSDADSTKEDSDEGKSKPRSGRKNKSDKKMSAKSQAKLDRRLLRSFGDARLLQKPHVVANRLEKADLLKFGIEELPEVKKKAQSNSSDSDDEMSIARLINLKSAKKRSHAKSDSASADSSADDVKQPKKAKKSEKSKKKAKKSKDGENADSLHSGSENEAEDALGAPAALISDNPLTEQELRDMNNRELKERLLATSSDEDDAESAEDSKKKTPKKDAKDKAEDDGKSSAKKKSKKGKSASDSGDKKGSDTDNSDILPERKKRSTRSKLLHQRLSMSDSSEDEAKFKAKEARLKKEKGNAPDTSSNSDSEEDAMLKPRSSRKKSSRGKIKSDSDDSVHIAESSSTNSDDDFVIPKNKRKGKASDSDSSDQKKKKVKRRRIKTPKDDSDDSDPEDPSQASTPGKGRKNIRKVMTEESVGEQTKRAAREELERKKRIEERQILYNKLNGIVGTKDKNVVTEKLVLDFDPDTKEELVKVHDSIVRKLKPHQVRGVEFMWNVCYESVKQLEKNKGAGCILAHCMGLGKTFQVVTLVHTLLTNPLTQVKTVLVVCPLSTALNWVNEFRIWLKDTRDEEEVDVYELSRYKKPIERMHKLEEWKRNGGVMVMNYELYRTLSMNKVKKLKQTIKKSWERSLVDPGPDLVVCDEGHLLKNEDSAISKAMRKVKTLRRIVLTGTPLQNNLVEYHCMVNFVRPNLLGTRKEFLNRFVNPITNGQYEDSTAHDVKIMKRRAHVLHKMLDGIVQRYDYAELTPFLPEKQEYVISVRLSEPQTKIYQHYLDKLSGLALIQSGVRNTRLLPDWHVFQRINTHPKVLLYHDEGNADKDEEKSDDSEGSLKDFIDDDEDSSSDSSSSGSGGSKGKAAKPPPPRRRLRGDPEPEEPEKVELPAATSSEEWWREYCTDDVINGINSSGKLALLFSLLRECEKIGDKVLVFSQSLFSLRLIEDFLERLDRDTRRVQREARNADSDAEPPAPDPQLGGHSGIWVKGFDYFRLDGSISAENRNKDCKRFNNKSDLRARLYLISTRAGGLGINLVAANRVVVFDASWNPSHDVQSIFRVFRFGQVKPCYIYRFLAYSTIEERVYERQVTKLSLSCRVVDEQQIDRHYTNKDIMAMYTFDHAHKTDRPTPILPKDRMLAELLKEHAEWIETYHEHDSLLENKAEEELNEEERKAAWEEYEFEKRPQIHVDQHAYMLKNNVEALRNLLKTQNPEADDAAIDAAILNLRALQEQAEAKQALQSQQWMLQNQQRAMLFQQQQLQQQQQFNAMQRTNPYYQPQQGQYAMQSTSGGNYRINTSQQVAPGMQAFMYQKAKQADLAKNAGSGLPTSRHLVKIPPQLGAGAPPPRISVRSMADMQMRPGYSNAAAAVPRPGFPRLPIRLPGANLTPVKKPNVPHQYPRVDIAIDPNSKDPKKSGAPLSPIDID